MMVIAVILSAEGPKFVRARLRFSAINSVHAKSARFSCTALSILEGELRNEATSSNFQLSQIPSEETHIGTGKLTSAASEYFCDIEEEEEEEVEEEEEEEEGGTSGSEATYGGDIDIKSDDLGDSTVTTGELSGLSR